MLLSYYHTIISGHSPAYNAGYYRTIILSYQGTGTWTRGNKVRLTDQAVHLYASAACALCATHSMSVLCAPLAAYRSFVCHLQHIYALCSNCAYLCFVRHLQRICALCATCSISMLCAPLTAYRSFVCHSQHIYALCVPLSAYLCFVRHLQHIEALCATLSISMRCVSHSQHIKALCATHSISMRCAPLAAYLCFVRQLQHIYALSATRSISMLCAPLAAYLCFVRHLQYVLYAPLAAYYALCATCCMCPSTAHGLLFCILPTKTTSFSPQKLCSSRLRCCTPN